jgi:hypothetical protein
MLEAGTGRGAVEREEGPLLKAACKAEDGVGSGCEGWEDWVAGPASLWPGFAGVGLAIASRSPRVGGIFSIVELGILWDEVMFL